MAFDWGSVLSAAVNVGGSLLANNAANSAANSAANTTSAATAQALGMSEQQYRDLIARVSGAAGDVAGVQRGLYNDSIGRIDQARDQTLGIQRDAYNSSTAANAPYLTTGRSALNTLARTYGLDTVGADGQRTAGTGQANFDAFQASPDYQFRFEQGIKGVDAGAAARGMLDSGATRKAEIKYAGNLASGEFGSYAQRLANLAGVGQNAASAQNNANANFANGAGGTITNAANSAVNANTGFGSSYGNTVTGAANTIANAGTGFGSSYANLVQNAANNNANSQLVQGANNSNLYGNIAGMASGVLQNNPQWFAPNSSKPVTSGVLYNDINQNIDRNPQTNGGYYL